MDQVFLDQLDFSPRHPVAVQNWHTIPDRPGVYVIFDGEEVIYVGMAGRNGKGSLRRRLRDHASGQVVNMFVQYLLFDRILFSGNPPRSPRAAKERCRAYIREHCEVRFLALDDKVEAFRIEALLKQTVQPTFNGDGSSERIKAAGVGSPRRRAHRSGCA